MGAYYKLRIWGSEVRILSGAPFVIFESFFSTGCFAGLPKGFSFSAKNVHYPFLPNIATTFAVASRDACFRAKAFV